MTRLRWILAAPFYLFAFLCHLLTALFTAIAEKVAGPRALYGKRNEGR